MTVRSIVRSRARPALRRWRRWRRSRYQHCRADRGDVPGWVLIAVMTAGLVTVLWAVAGPRLTSMLEQALDSVVGP
ncbi:MAG: hypothetical protein L0Y54_05415 [Sporichthyaceae bacterium]|nr:hypothetical protein [Sporichthyaceae bacterium]